jgi:uncharacterized membrane protein YdcZ (DUF606 family)
MDTSVIWYAMLGGLLGGIVMSGMTAVARKRDITRMSIRVIEGAISPETRTRPARSAWSRTWW